MLREGIARLLTDAGMEVVGRCPNATDLMLKVASYEPDVAVVDIRMPPTHTDEGIRAAMEIRERHPNTGVLVLSQYVELGPAMEFLAASPEGAGYLLKDRISDIAEFAGAVKRVGSGGSAIDPTIVSQLLGRVHGDDELGDLTPREREVLALMAEGWSNQAIAEKLVITLRSAEKHVSAIFSKLGLPSHRQRAPPRACGAALPPHLRARPTGHPRWTAPRDTGAPCSPRAAPLGRSRRSGQPITRGAPHGYCRSQVRAACRRRGAAAVTARDVVRRYGQGETAVDALRGVSVDIAEGRLTAVMGPSGSGKSTLMHILAGLDKPTSGEVTVAGVDISGLDDTALTKLRRDHIGFIFQFFNLLPMLTAAENIVLPLKLAGIKPDLAWVEQVTTDVGLVRPSRAPPVGAVRRPAAARRRRPRARLAPVGDVRRRADRQPRLDDQRRDPRPAARRPSTSSARRP